ncbi:aminodeoxychorismate synthase component I [Pseudomonas sp. 5P_3.1_Bac2]|uniref:aminodeoxychorismate synthase component I n=1 Tax=Pseudomonas sp. 5P_3.1_Bac2 TaxID=2971617 RepID=UPI0021CAD45D|nr:aminodeoxychorismate synthase component I [Pseudomonas sp. 5P_3.1_Bac2]MCU1716298.1 aminodeoxychorismate synthase component I [Pseudomonas sp. 5P_3.1_Bac2]
MSTCLIQDLPYQADPLSYFLRIAQAPGALLLDAGRPFAERGRFDLLSAWPLAQFSPEPEESGRAYLQRLRQALRELGPSTAPEGSELPFTGGLIGYLSYDFGRRLEQLPSLAQADRNLPDARFGLYGWALISDHQLKRSHLVFHPSLSSAEQQRLSALFSRESPAQPPAFSLLKPFSPDLSSAQYLERLQRIAQYIQAGDCYQVNFAQRFTAPYQGSPLAAYQALRQACPTPFSGYLHLGGDNAIISLSPERFLRISQGQVETRPIKGTRPRHSDPQQDQAAAADLLASPKDRAENLMIVDLLRNDLGRSCRIGSVRVPELFALESYPNVHHLVSAVTGELAEGKDALDLLAASFPGGSITGAPKIRAMQIIDELEPTRRSIYCGSLLYVDVRGEMDSSITIRTLLAQDGQISCWGGGGIVADSQAQDEYQESITKVKVLLQTLEQLPA